MRQMATGTLGGPVHMGSQGPSPTQLSKSQHGDKVPTFEPQETIKVWFIFFRVGCFIISCKTIHSARVESWI